MQAAGQRVGEWDRLRVLVARVNSNGLSSLSEAELCEFPGIYRKVISDLSLMRSRGDAPHIVQELSMLCNQAHAVLYQRRRSQGTPFLEYIGAVLPQAAREAAGYIWAAAAITLVFAVLGWLHYAVAPELAYTTMSEMQPDMLKEWEHALHTAKSESELRLAAQIPEEERGFSAIAITANNIRVGVLAFVCGLAAGVPTLILLGINGYLLGVIGCLYHSATTPVGVNLPLYFWAGIAPHGFLELPAICVSGGAGLLLGLSWLFPGARPRGVALREGARLAGRLVLVTVIMLLLAGSIEAFITPLRTPAGFTFEVWAYLKIAFGTLTCVLWSLWLGLGGRERRRRSMARRA
jgi:uncharacterized membrane protein SpoIIM required for sporulation